MPTSITPPPADDETECGNCGAYIYAGLVRCPNCGVYLLDPPDTEPQERPRYKPKSRLSGWQWAWGAQDDADSIAAIQRGLDLGINWIDTATQPMAWAMPKKLSAGSSKAGEISSSSPPNAAWFGMKAVLRSMAD